MDDRDPAKEDPCMKKALIGGALSLVGSMWAIAVMLIAGNNLADSWQTGLGRFWSTVVGMRLMFPFVLSALIAVPGIVLMAVDLFRKADK